MSSTPNYIPGSTPIDASIECLPILKAIISSSSDAIIAIDLEKKIIMFNQRAETLLGYSKSEMDNKSVEVLYENVEVAREIYQTIQDFKKIERTNIGLRHKDGRKIPISLSGNLIQSDDGTVLGQVGFFRDLREIQFVEARLNTLIETGKTINTTVELNKKLECTIEAIIRSIPPGDHCVIYLFDEKKNLYLAQSNIDHLRMTNETANYVVEENTANWVFEHQQHFYSGNAITGTDCLQSGDAGVELQQHLLCVPISSKERRLGAIFLSAPKQHGAFTQPDLDLLHGFADQLAIAMETSEQIKKTNKHVEELEYIRKTSLRINAQTKIEEILTALLESGNKLLGTEMAVVHWKGNDKRGIQTFVVPEALQKLKTNPRLKGGLTAEIFRNGKEIIVHDTKQDGRVNPSVLEAGIRSLVGYPLHLKGRVAGALFFNSLEHQFFGEHEIELLSLLLPLVAVAIENANTIEQNERAKQLSDSLMQLSSEISRKLVLTEQMLAIKQFILGNLAAPMFYLGIYDENSETIEFLIDYDERSDQASQAIQKKHNGQWTISGYVIENQKPIIWYTEEQKYEECQRLGIKPIQSGEPCKTCLAFPLEVEGKILGVISIQHTEPNAWEEIEVSTFRTLAYQSSIAIRNAQLMQEINDSFKLLENTYLAGKKIISELDPYEALNVLVENICKAVGAYRACAVLFKEGGIPNHISTSGFVEELELSTAVRKDGISNLVYRTREGQFINDILKESHRVHPKILEQGVQAAACLPLDYKGNCRGVLWLHYNKPHIFHAREKETLSQFTNQATIAYENAKLHQQINKAIELGRVVAHMTVLGNLTNTLDSIVKGVKDVLDCDIVTLYTYWQEKDQFDLIPAIAGELCYPGEITRTGTVDRSATPYKVINLGDIYVAEDTLKDPILGSPFARRENVCSTIAAPLKTHDRQVGVLFINYLHKKQIFTSQEIANIRLFSEQAAIAINNAMLYESNQKRKKVLKIVDDAGRIVTSSLELEKILKNLAHLAYDLTSRKGEPAKFATITLVERSHTILKAVYPPTEQENIIGAGFTQVHLDTGVSGRIGLIGRAVKNKAAILVKDVEGHPDFLRSSAQTACELAVPILYQDEVVGVINVEHEKIGGLDEEDQQDIQSLAAHAAIAIQNARMYQSLQRKNQHQAALYEGSKIINANIELTKNELLKILVKLMATKIVPITGAMNVVGAINLFDDEKKELELVCTFPDNAFGDEHIGEVRSLTLPPNGKIGITGLAACRKIPQRVDDVRLIDNYIKYNGSTKSELDVPMKEGDTVIGVLSLECDQLNGFDKEAEDALIAFAEIAIIALRNIRRYQELKESRARVGNITAIAWMGLVATAWRHAIGNMATTIKDYTELIQIDLTAGEPKDKIEQRLFKIQNIVNEIQKIPMYPLSSEQGVEYFYICQFVRDRINQFQQKSQYRNIKFELTTDIDELTMVRASPEWLRRILDILIDNAKEAIKQLKDKHITVHIGQANKGVEIQLTDNGTGIPERIRPILFDEPIHKEPGEQGSGIGLFLANSIIQVFSGKLEISSTGPQGTTMAVWLPIQTTRGE